MKKFLFIFIFLFSYDSSAEQKLTLVASINNSVITNLDISNEVELIAILNNSISVNNEAVKKAALDNLVEEILKSSAIKKNSIDDIANNLIDKQYNSLLKKISQNNKSISPEIKKNIYEKILLDYQWNTLVSKKYSWMISVNMSEIDDKLKTAGEEINDQNKYQIKKNELIMIERNKKLSVYSQNYLEQIKKKALIKFF
jgi:hypothetical protein|tara:strand:- start:710 stop:1306 length:597 start_codon:yes stop_codon:yes gene_type:complete